MKKFAVLLAGLLVVSASQAFGFGVGAEFSAPFTSSGVGTGAALTFKLDKVPYVFAVGASGNGSGVHLGATADYWMAEGHLVSFLDWYLGPGLFLDVNTGSNGGLAGGVRVPIGLNGYFFDKHLELFVELAPALGISVAPFQFPTLGLQDALGFRFWF